MLRKESDTELMQSYDDQNCTIELYNIKDNNSYNSDYMLLYLTKSNNNIFYSYHYDIDDSFLIFAKLENLAILEKENMYLYF
jgi:hypothetical protein